MARLTESNIESATLDWLESIGWRIAYGPDIALDTLLAERTDHMAVSRAPRFASWRTPTATTGWQ